jgi:hypothetical protein
MYRTFGLLLGVVFMGDALAQEPADGLGFGARATYTLTFGRTADPLQHSLSLGAGSLRNTRTPSALELRLGSRPEFRIGGLGAVEEPEEDRDKPVFLGLSQREWTYAGVTSLTLIAALLIIDHINEKDEPSGTGASN